MSLSIKHSANLDVVRSIAVFMVVLRHVLGILGVERIGIIDVQFVGIFGVLLFFILTAHVLMFSLERMRRDRSSLFLLYFDFIVRRIFRIFPLSICVVGFLFILSRFGSVPGVRHLSVYEAIANLFLVQNFTGAPDIIGTLWSLPIEVQMYLFLPLIFFVVRDRSLRVTALVYVIAVLSAVVFYKATFGHVARYAPCFFPGVVTYVLVSKVPKKIFPFSVLLVGLVIAWLSYQLLGRWSQTVGGFPACLALGLLFPFVSESKSDLLISICKSIAKYSYGIYLIHIPVLAVCFLLPFPAFLKLIVFFVATWLLSVLAYKLIEDPMIRFGNRLTDRRHSAAGIPHAL